MICTERKKYFFYDQESSEMIKNLASLCFKYQQLKKKTKKKEEKKKKENLLNYTQDFTVMTCVTKKIQGFIYLRVCPHSLHRYNLSLK